MNRSQTYIALAKSLATEFAETALERDVKGGTPKVERDRLRQSNLLQLMIPEEYGGLGETWITTFKISRELAKVDSSIAHIFSYHNLGVVIPHIYGSPAQKQHYYTESSLNNWFWGNAVNPRDQGTTLTPQDSYFVLNGSKSFCSGSCDSDILPVTATNPQTGEVIILVIPTGRTGVRVNGDWDSMGQRQTDSGSVDFQNVVVYPQKILGLRNNSNSIFTSIRSCMTQLNMANIFLGIAQGAFEAAKKYTTTITRPWVTSGVETATQDPYILQHYGNMWVDLQAVTTLVEQAGELLQAAWEQDKNLTATQRGACAIAVYTAKVAATRVGLDVTSRIFEVMGARSTGGKYGFDRYWRNIRTFTLHDPVDYKVRDLGNWVLNQELPKPNLYS